MFVESARSPGGTAWAEPSVAAGCRCGTGIALWLAMPDRAGAAEYRGRIQVVAANAETRDQLCRYLTEGGVAAHGSSALIADQSVHASGIVAFPDDFAEDEIISYVRQTRMARPDMVFVIVTRAVQRWLGMTSSNGSALDLTVLPRPSFAWTILDALRGQDAAAEPGPRE